MYCTSVIIYSHGCIHCYIQVCVCTFLIFTHFFFINFSGNFIFIIIYCASNFIFLYIFSPYSYITFINFTDNYIHQLNWQLHFHNRLFCTHLDSQTSEVFPAEVPCEEGRRPSPCTAARHLVLLSGHQRVLSLDLHRQGLVWWWWWWWWEGTVKYISDDGSVSSKWWVVMRAHVLLRTYETEAPGTGPSSPSIVR